MMSSELPPMLEYTGHVIQTETRNQYTALSFVGFLLHIYEFSDKGFEFLPQTLIL